MISGMADRVAALTGAAVAASTSLTGGDIGLVTRVELADGRIVVAKTARSGGRDTAEAEAAMLVHMHDCGVRVPAVLAAEPGLLIMEAVPDRGSVRRAEDDLARVVAQMHGVRRGAYGFDHDTVFAGDHQDNRAAGDWPSFFADRRLKPMARLAHGAGRLDRALVERVDRLADGLGALLPADPPAALLHGDLWQGNILCDGDRISALIDPALYYGHAEVDLAMLTLFGGVGARFFAAYGDQAPFDATGFAERRDLYNLYPLLFHVKAFGGAYLGQVEDILRRFGC